MSVPVNRVRGERRSSSEQVKQTGLQWWPPDVSSRGGGRSHVWYPGGGVGYPYPNVSWVMVIWETPTPSHNTQHPVPPAPPTHTEWQTPVKTLPSRNFVCGGNYNSGSYDSCTEMVRHAFKCVVWMIHVFKCVMNQKQQVSWTICAQCENLIVLG